jgi:RNA polymerase sigma-70 factor (ECF subfamily)
MNAAVLDSPPRADSESMEELWRINGTGLKRFALKLTRGDQHRAEDIIQETLLRAWRHPELVDGHADTIRPWLFTVSRHVAIDMWRDRSRHNNYVIEDHLTDSPDLADCIDQAVTAMEVRAALMQLRPEHRQVIFETYFLGRSVAEVAARRGIPEGTVKSRSYYGLRQLKKLLATVPDQQAA